jgi:hypothetical protein
MCQSTPAFLHWLHPFAPPHQGVTILSDTPCHAMVRIEALERALARTRQAIAELI